MLLSLLLFVVFGLVVGAVARMLVGGPVGFWQTSAVGIAGVLSFLVSERTSEIGIRMSLGADARNVLGMVLWDGARLLAVGSALGLVGSFAVTRLLQGLLYGTEAGDPRTLAGVLLVMTTVGLAATAGPALRAARVDPLEAIRKE